MYRDQDSRQHEEKVGHSWTRMTAAKAASIRALRQAGRESSNTERRARAKAERQANLNRPTINALWALFKEHNQHLARLGSLDTLYSAHLKKSFGDMTPDEIPALALDKLRVRLTRTYAPANVRHVLGHLRRIVNFGFKRGLCQPMSFKIQMPKVHNEKTETLTVGQLRSLQTALADDYDREAAGLVALALFTGMRRGELFRLRWEDIDLAQGFITIRDPKQGATHTVHLSEPAMIELSALPRHLNGWVLPGMSSGRRIDGTRRFKAAMARLRDAADLPDGFRMLHGLRHVFASTLASAGTDLYTVGTLLGHHSPQMTKRYAHLSNKALRDATELAGRTLGGMA